MTPIFSLYSPFFLLHHWLEFSLFTALWVFHISSSSASLLTPRHYLSFAFFPFVLPCSSLSPSLHPSLSSWGNTTDISATWLPDTVSTPFLLPPASPRQSLVSLPPPLALPSLSGAKAKAEISPRACRGDWYQIAVKMEMPIKLTASFQPSFLSPLKVKLNVYRSGLLRSIGKREERKEYSQGSKFPSLGRGLSYGCQKWSTLP